MRLLLIGSLLFSGGTAVAMQNETVQEEVSNVTARARYVIQKRFKARLLDEVKEAGFPYPPESYLEGLTEEQQTAILTTIDQINAEYDWPNMTDEDIIDALKLVKEEMDALYDELGIDGPTLRERIREAVQNRMTERVKEDGIPYPSDEYLSTLTEEQQTALLAVIDNANTTYDWANMTDDEIHDALVAVHQELIAVADEYGFELPPLRDRVRPFYRHQEDMPCDDDDVDGDANEV